MYDSPDRTDGRLPVIRSDRFRIQRMDALSVAESDTARIGRAHDAHHLRRGAVPRPAADGTCLVGGTRLGPPEGTEPDWIFAEIDVARVRLIYASGRAMAVPEETMPLVLSCSTRSTPSAARCAPSLGPWSASRRRYGTRFWLRSGGESAGRVWPRSLDARYGQFAPTSVIRPSRTASRKRTYREPRLVAEMGG